uniref:Putative secreted protein n=1 Tax=Ixodes ricinus TaxID=34613 RepID=A0A6B0UIN6_IXORI
MQHLDKVLCFVIQLVFCGGLHARWLRRNHSLKSSSDQSGKMLLLLYCFSSQISNICSKDYYTFIKFLAEKRVYHNDCRLRTNPHLSSEQNYNLGGVQCMLQKRCGG